jgi:hypothetical protein
VNGRISGNADVEHHAEEAEGLRLTVAGPSVRLTGVAQAIDTPTSTK